MIRTSRGYSIEEFELDFKKKYFKDFARMNSNLIRVSPGGWVLPSTYLEYEEKLYNFKFRPDDVVVMAYPKCGSTWTQEIVWTMHNNPDLDHPDSADELYVRSPFIDFDMWFPLSIRKDVAVTPPAEINNPVLKGLLEQSKDNDSKEGIMFQISEALPSPRTLKTHLPFPLFDKNLLDACKVVYVARNPKDAILSYQHHCRLFKYQGFIGTQDAFIDYFVEGTLNYGSYAEHLKEAWQLRHHPNLLWVFYEDLKKDTLGQLRRLDAFMGTELTEDQLLNVEQHTSFSNMKANDPLRVEGSLSVNSEIQKKDGGFHRQGEVGSWKGKYTAEQESKIDDWIKKNFKGSDLQFTYQESE